MVSWIACDRFYDSLMKKKHPKWQLLPYGNKPEDDAGYCDILAMNYSLPRGGREGDINWSETLEGSPSLLTTDLPFHKNDAQWEKWKTNMENCGCHTTRHLKRYRPEREWVEVQHLHTACLAPYIRCAIEHLLEDA